MKRTIFILLVILSFGCGDIIDITDPTEGPEAGPSGLTEVEFVLPSYGAIPKEGIHRILLAFAYTMDSLNKELFFKRINVSDQKMVYTNSLMPGTFAFIAAIGCSCDGDTCLYGGFPGGKYGLKYDYGEFTVEADKTTCIKTTFTY